MLKQFFFQVLLKTFIIVFLILNTIIHDNSCVILDDTIPGLKGVYDIKMTQDMSKAYH